MIGKRILRVSDGIIGDIGRRTVVFPNSDQKAMLNVFPAKSLIHPAELFRINIWGGMVIAI